MRQAETMKTALDQAMTFRLELFVSHLPTSIDFYRRVLGFKVGEQQPDGYTPMTNGAVRIALNRRSGLPDDHPVQLASHERPGRGIELVLEVDDIGAMVAHVLSQNWPLAGELKQQPWGLTDFRVLDPDGYYWRVTSRG
jgi:catechol 2,3-dioxygenase-like lactoylglutathione lyase family enzyme